MIKFADALNWELIMNENIYNCCCLAICQFRHPRRKHNRISPSWRYRCTLSPPEREQGPDGFGLRFPWHCHHHQSRSDRSDSACHLFSYHPRFIELSQRLGISYDLFTSTHTENHFSIAQKVFLTLLEMDTLTSLFPSNGTVPPRSVFA